MDDNLKEQFVHAIFRFRKSGMTLPAEFDIRITELFLLRSISANISHPNKSVHVSVIQNKLHITKPAVSQMLNSLEKRGYVKREMDKDDRRKIAVTLTSAGEEILKKAQEYFNLRLEATISRFGVENTKQITHLFNLLADINEDLKS